MAQITIVGDNGKSAVIEVDLRDPLENVMILAEVELGIPAMQQRVRFNNKVLTNPAAPLASYGVAAGASLLIHHAPSGSPQSAGSADNAIRQLFSRSNPSAPAPTGDADALVRNLFAQSGAHPSAPRPSAPVDPMDPEYQRRLLEQIHQQNIQQNLEQALEHTPESFGSVIMLYVPATVNKVDVTAFIDSGAQMTIMNEKCAERCGILHLLDRRMQGFARGVSSARLLGRIHMAMVNVGGNLLPMSISVLESQDIEFIIGLDQMKRHQMCIDLKDNVLRVHGSSVPFLGEGELPAHYRSQPTAPGGEEHEALAKLSAEQKDKLQQLMQLSGAARVAALSALEACGWNIELAMAMLVE